jgi:hypothetical protein
VSGKCLTLVGTENNWLDNRVNYRPNVDMMGRRKVAAQLGTKPASSFHVTMSVLAVSFVNVLPYL